MKETPVNIAKTGLRQIRKANGKPLMGEDLKPNQLVKVYLGVNLTQNDKKDLNLALDMLQSSLLILPTDKHEKNRDKAVNTIKKILKFIS